MPHVLRLLFWSIGLAFVAWIFRIILNDEDSLEQETIVSRIRKSGF
jgi:hypothetical protein